MKQGIFTAAARRELAEATAWFDQHSALGGAAFEAMIYEAVAAICEMPLAAPPWPTVPRLRVRTLKHVKYRVFYEVTDDEIRIVAIAHTSRRPGYWLGRVR